MWANTIEQTDPHHIKVEASLKEMRQEKNWMVSRCYQFSISSSVAVEAIMNACSIYICFIDQKEFHKQIIIA